MKLGPALAIALAAATADAPAGAAAPPAGFQGTWDVVRVEADRQDQMHWEAKPQDPQLLYRELVIGKTRRALPPQGAL